MTPLAVFAAALVAFTAVGVLLVRMGMQWGSTPEERGERLPGDAYLAGGPPARVVMTRAVSVAAPPETVWPWLAQLGRGAGFYSYDRLDNGGKTSARHILSWVPPPRPGDATAIGYLKHVDAGRGLTWWVPGGRFFGAEARLVTDIHLRREGSGSRLMIRMSADACGLIARPALWAFRVIDSVMARGQIVTIRERAEEHGARAEDPEHPETGARDQYQLYEVIYAHGNRAGVRGKEEGERWRAEAVRAGVIAEEDAGPGC